VTDGLYVWISGRVANEGPLMTLVEESTQLALHQITDGESADFMVRFEYNGARAIRPKRPEGGSFL
jgi:hypothetical protein